MVCVHRVSRMMWCIVMRWLLFLDERNWTKQYSYPLITCLTGHVSTFNYLIVVSIKFIPIGQTDTPTTKRTFCLIIFKNECFTLRSYNVHVCVRVCWCYSEMNRHIREGETSLQFVLEETKHDDSRQPFILAAAWLRQCIFPLGKTWMLRLSTYSHRWFIPLWE